MRQTRKNTINRIAYIVDGNRTPFIRARGKPGPFEASDLAVIAAQHLLLKCRFLASNLDEVIIGCVMPSINEANIARVIGLRLGTGPHVPAWTVQRNCASGLQALDSAARNIWLNRSNIVLAGGTEAMSQAPLLFAKRMVTWLSDLQRSKQVTQKLKVITQFRPNFLVPIIALLHGLTDPIVGLNMGQTAEKLGFEHHITRNAMDIFSMVSHQRAQDAWDAGWMDEVIPIIDKQGTVYKQDNGIRADNSLEKLANLKPAFDQTYGSVTPGNSSQITDGAAMLLLASNEAVDRYDLPVCAKIVDTAWVGVDPATMGIGPALAITALLKQNQLTFSDIDYFEINEAFAGQVLACLSAMEDPNFRQDTLEIDDNFGQLDPNRLNVNGGAIALGHPIGASGARLALHMTRILQREQASRGVISLCVGGGQGRCHVN